MKNIVIIFIIGLLSSFGLFKKKKLRPPGTTHFKENVFVDETEVSNQNWRDYVYWNKKQFGDTSSIYLNSLPDTSVWRDTVSLGNNIYSLHYFQHKAYRGYPVVGVSYEQVINYCNWRSDRVNEYIFVRRNNIELIDFSKNRSKYRVSDYVLYRLPSIKEFNEFSTVGYTNKVLKKTNKKDVYKSNFMRKGFNGADILAPSFSYYPNMYGLYCTQGNVAELVQEKGIAKGGHCKLFEKDFEPLNDYSFDKPNAYTGFRCVAEVLIP